jgi:AmiR/NasT family two-component response regulator
LVLAQAKGLATQLALALARQAVIDQAIGILMSRVGCDPDAARVQLAQTSRSANGELHLVAGRLVDEAVRRARDRLNQP